MDDLEVKLLDKCMRGDLNSFEILIQTYSKQVYNILYRILGNEEDAKDVSQEVFIKVYKKLHTFHGKSEFFTWLYQITINSAKDFIKRKKVLLSVDDLSDAGHELSDKKGGNPEESFMEVETKDAILKALLELKDEQRVIIVLRDIQGLSYEEISKVLEIGIGTVKSRINRSRMKLRQILTEGPHSI